MWFDEFDHLPIVEQTEFIIKTMDDIPLNDTLSFRDLHRLINHFEWRYSQWFTIPTILDLGLVMTPYLGYGEIATSPLGKDMVDFVFNMIENCFRIYA